MTGATTPAAILLDFYGTVVHEDDVIIDRVCQAISEASPFTPTPSDVGAFWWTSLANSFRRSRGHRFRLQRDLELASIQQTCDHFSADCDAAALAQAMFDHWQHPPVFDDALDFLQLVDVPVIVLSNIDRADLLSAIDAHGLAFDGIITSEDVRAYKPQPDLFLAGMASLGAAAHEVLHIGDSWTSDVVGASALGIPVVWLNRSGKPRRAGPTPTHEVHELRSLIDLL